ncbi:fibronectin type III domain-containing protein [Marinilabilia rubra]|uniref:Fibronectin type-III domain-containing protein n=1 Tax=Marinilabilia rubra TaxID=2162893 RepID=A0A2U2BE82_9BACT|nr:fibronectin type III domain-containing protein [Marinilabilia rubra]PWE01384.1 hypothetical protein DDZ16_02545 [Marinilabilia rubra]
MDHRLYFLRQVVFLALFTICFSLNAGNQSHKTGFLRIQTESGREIEQGVSGFNVRIADSPWNYTHPEFRNAVHTLKPGWLRYFSGTMGDAFNSATGLYDKDYAWMFDKQDQYFRGYAFTDVKGPHRIVDLYDLLGEVGGKLVVTINGFSETPEVAGELARFCKNNNIKVEVWQFCNEPYFYVPHRDRFWWNDGYDYALKMKPYAEAIREVFPDAKLALNYTWDGIWGFMKEIHKYQEKNGAYWDVFSKHSYAPHIGGKESFQNAYKRGNTRIISATSSKAMDNIEAYTREDVPMLITEFGVWNRPLNGIYSGIYYVEYTLRQLQHSNAFLIGSHEISNKYVPEKNLNKVVLDAYYSGKEIDTDTLKTGGTLNYDGKGVKIMHEATNNSDFTWDVEVNGAPLVEGLKNKEVSGVYARAFKGVEGHNYLVVTNRSGEDCFFDVWLGDETLEVDMERTFMASEKAQNKDFDIKTDHVNSNNVEIPAYSVVLLKWESKEKTAPSKSRIYKSSVVEDGIELKWWKRNSADKYEVFAGESSDNLKKVHSVEDGSNSYVVKGLKPDTKYYFAIESINRNGHSGLSETVSLTYEKPEKPEIFKVARRDTTITVMWKSVPDASGYKVRIKPEEGNEIVYDAENVFGYRISGLNYDEEYSVSVSAYNGLGQGDYSPVQTVICKEFLPIPPRNISAKETPKGSIALQWVHQDTINPGVKYRLFRGTDPSNMKMIKEEISGNHYLDESVKHDRKYFYTVKSYNDAGECNFHPNIATVISNDEIVSIEIVNIEKTEAAFKIEVSFENVKTDGNVEYGVALSDISYLNVEEDIFKTSEVSGNSYTIEIPFSELKKGRTYAIRGVIFTNGSPVYSLPPHKNISVE